jgi:HEAT repeat protein
MLGPKAQPALPALVKAFHLKQSSSAAGAALVCLGEEGIQEVIPALQSPDVWLRMSAAGALGETKLPEKFIPSLLEGLNDSDERVRYTTACSLHHLGNKSSVIVIPALAKMLLDPSPVVRTWAIRALSNYGKQATAVIPLLLAMMDDPDSRIKREAKLAVDLIEMGKR